MPRRRSAGEGSVYKTVRVKTRKDGTTYEVVTYRGYVTLEPLGGKRKRKYATAPTKAEALKKIRDLQNQRDEGSLTTTSSPTLQEWLEHYLKVLAPRKPIKGRKGNRRSTLATYKGYSKNWVYPTAGKVKLDQLRVEKLEAVLEAMADAGMAASSIHQCAAMLKVALEIAWKRGKIPRNVAKQIIAPAGAAPKVDRDVELEEMLRVLEVAKARRVGAKWCLRIIYGLRQGETLGLGWPDVDFEGKILRIRNQIQRDRTEHGCGDPVGVETSKVTYAHGCGEPTLTTVRADADRYKDPPPLARPRQVFPCKERQVSACPQVIASGGVERTAWPCGKAQAARCPQADGGGLVLVEVKTRKSDAALPLPDQIAALLKQRKADQRKERIQEGPRWTGWEVDGRQAELAFSQRNGKPVDPRSDWEEWTEILDEAGAEHIRPHAARGWAATMMVALEIHPRIAMTLMRHADIRTTLNLYARSPNPELRAAAEEMSTLFLGKAVGE